MQFGSGPQLAAQCDPPPQAPDGWRAWLPEIDGPIPEALEIRARSLIADPASALGATESFPLSGVTALLRVEPHIWGRDEQGSLIPGCFRAAGVYLPDSDANETITPPVPVTKGKLEKTIGVLTVASLVVGTIATLSSLGR